MIGTKLTKTNESESSTGGRHDSARTVRGVIGLLAGIPSRMARRVSALTRSTAKSKKSVKSTVNAKKSAPKKKVAKKVTARKAAPKKSAAKRVTPKKKPAAAKKAVSKTKAKAKKPTARRAALKNVKKKATSSGKTAVKSKPKKAAKPVAAKKAPPKKTAAAKKAPVKKTKAAKAPKPVPKPVENPNKRRPRVYSTRSTHDSFMIGDEIIFRQVRDWSDSNRLIEMKGTLIAMGTDFDNHVNYIEVQFEVEGPTGRTEKQVRRFAVR